MTDQELNEVETEMRREHELRGCDFEGSAMVLLSEVKRLRTEREQLATALQVALPAIGSADPGGSQAPSGPEYDRACAVLTSLGFPLAINVCTSYRGRGHCVFEKGHDGPHSFAQIAQAFDRVDTRNAHDARWPSDE